MQTLTYALRQSRYWLSVIERLTRQTSDKEVPPSPEREKSPHTPLKEKATSSSQEESALRRFIKPTVEEVAEYCRAHGSRIDPAQFVAFYEAKGWMIGKNRMKNWKAAVITWERRQKAEATRKAPRKADNWRGTKPEAMDDVL